MYRLPRNSYEFNTDPNKGIDYILSAIRAIQNTNVSQIIAGTNISISPVSGTGAVTINASGGTTPTLDQVTTAGNTTANAITVSSVYVDAQNGGGLYNSTYNDVYMKPTSNSWDFFVRTSSTTDQLRFSTDGTFYINSVANGLALGRLHGGNYPKAQITMSFSSPAGYTAFGDRDGNEKMRLEGSTGNVLIGTTTDAGYKLDVNGTGRFVDTIRIAQSGFLRNADITMGNNLYINASHGGIYFNVFGNSYQYITTTLNQLFNKVQINYGTQLITRNASLSVGGSITASTALAQGVLYDGTLVASANNDVLVGLDINPTFNNGAFTGVENYALRVKGSTQYIFTTGDGLILNRDGAGNYIRPITQPLVLYSPNSSVYQYINNSGVGINTPPSARFHIKGSGSTSSTTTLKLENSLSTASLIVNDGGNVLIGTTTDAGYKLDVNGSARVQGNLYFSTSGSYFYGDTNNIRLYDKNNSIILQSFPSGVANSETYLKSSSGNKFIRINDSAITLEWFNGNVSDTVQKPINIIRGFFGNVVATDKTVLNITTPFFSNLTNATTLTGILIDINDTTTYTGFTTVRAIETVRGDVVFNGGNVGIGTTAPEGPLHVKYSSATVPGITIENDGVGYNAGSMTLRSGTTGGTNMSVTVGGGMYWYNLDSFSNTLSLPATGNLIVGGAVDAGYRLDVQGGDARFAQNVEAATYSVAGNAGYSGIINFPLNPPGSQNLEFLQGILINVF